MQHAAPDLFCVCRKTNFRASGRIGEIDLADWSTAAFFQRRVDGRISSKSRVTAARYSQMPGRDFEARICTSQRGYRTAKGNRTLGSNPFRSASLLKAAYSPGELCGK
jgi:hypothetical protein